MVTLLHVHRKGATGYDHLVAIRAVVAEDSLIVREGLQRRHRAATSSPPAPM
jgi:hypothetical protein